MSEYGQKADCLLLFPASAQAEVRHLSRSGCLVTAFGYDATLRYLLAKQ